MAAQKDQNRIGITGAFPVEGGSGSGCKVGTPNKGLRACQTFFAIFKTGSLAQADLKLSI